MAHSPVSNIGPSQRDAAPLAHALLDQLIEHGYCTVADVAPPALIAKMRRVTDAIVAQMSEREKHERRLQGSLIDTMAHPALSEIIGCPAALDALRAMGFPNPKFFIGFIISKPPETAPPLYWHQDGFTWDEPLSYTDTPIQLFLMYYLVDTTPYNGCLRVIPGSHRKRHELHKIPPPDREETKNAQEGQPALEPHPDEVDVCVRAGDLVIGDHRLLHSAHANRSTERRTCLTLWFCPLYEQLPEQFQAIYGPRRKKPAHWPDEDWARLAPLYAHYQGKVAAANFNRLPGPQLK
ncbi:MAG: phytanoyl-CoA dioxygenase family protein [Candidatus Latescibacteria bacterium]|jgi:hypothetical protein|nr:phytanoyl-CoA dioxygenase family protein [Candidatus Latescibacterota bacterium]